MQSFSRALPTANLPKIPYTLPKEQNFVAESTGAFKKEWLRGLPAYRKMAENARYLPSHEDFWKASPSQAVSLIASRMSYHDILQSATLDGIMPIEALLRSPGAPTPDLVYDDIMRWKTFDRIQKPPEEQFLLEANILQQLLAQCAHLVMVDPEYFPRAELFFQKLEHQQNVGSAAYSCWALMCVASGRIGLGLEVLAFMDVQRMSFDQHVFVLCMNPGASDFQSRIRGGEKSSKGFVRQLRLLNRLTVTSDERYMASAPGIHAFFVMFNLTLNHIRKWELIRSVVQDGRFLISQRTVHYVSAMLEAEGARRCGPMTIQALLVLFARNGQIQACFSLLSRVRQNEAVVEHTRMCPVVVLRPQVIRSVEKYLEASFNHQHAADKIQFFDDEPEDDITSFSDVLDAVKQKNALKGEKFLAAVQKTHGEAEKSRAVMCAWISFLMRVRENGVSRSALSQFVSRVYSSREGNNGVKSLPLKPSSTKSQTDVVRTATQTPARHEFLRNIMPAEPLKPLSAPVKKKSVTKSTKLKGASRGIRRVNTETVGLQAAKETKAPLIIEVPKAQDIDKKTPEGPTQSSNLEVESQEQPKDVPKAPGKKSVTPFKTKKEDKNYVEDIPAANNPFEQDEERKAMFERVRKRQETQTDIDSTQQKQAMDQMFQRENERKQRLARLPQAWTLS